MPENKRIQDVSTAAWIIAAYILTCSLVLPFDLSLAILLAGILFLMVKNSSGPSWDTPVNRAIVAFLLVYAVCVLFSENIIDSFLLGVALVPAILVHYLIGQSTGLKDLVVILTAMLLLLVYQAAQVLLAAIHMNDALPAEVITATGSLALIVPNDVVFFALMVPFVLFMIETTKYRSTIVLLAGILVLFLFLIIYLQSRVALLTYALVLFVYVLLRFKKIPLRLLLAVGGVILAADALLGFSLTQKILSLSDSRLPLWYAAWQMFIEHPLLGFGPHTYGEFYQAFFVSEGFPQHVVVDSRHTPWPHNLYLELLAGYGLAGFVSFMALMFFAGRRLLNHFKNSTGDQQVLSCALLAVMSGFLFAAIFELTLLRLWVVIFLFIMLGLAEYNTEYLYSEKHAKKSKRKLRKISIYSGN